MKIRQILLACATVMALKMSPVWAGGENSSHDRANSNHEKTNTTHVIGNGGGEHSKTPETDAKPGKNPIALIKSVFHGSPNTNHDKVNSGGEHFKAPEIDASSGKNAIALITGVLLLVGERVRSRRPAKVE